MSMERPYVQGIKGKWRIVWAETHDGHYEVDRNFTQYDTYAKAEKAFESVFGYTPESYGIGF